MNVYIFSYHGTNNVNILWKSSDTIESVLFFFLVCSSKYYPASEYNPAYAVLFFFNFSVTQVTNQPYSIYSISPASGHASKGRFKTRKSRDSANTTLTTNFFTWLEKKNIYALNNWNNHFILWFIAKWWKHVMRTQRRQLFFKS